MREKCPIDQKTKIVKLTIDMEESAENPAGPRGGHVEWTKNRDESYEVRNTVGMVGLADAQSYVITRYKPEYELHGSEARSDNGVLVVTETHDLHDDPDNDEEVFGAYGCLEVFGTRGFSDLKEIIKEFAGGYSDVDTESFISTPCSKSKLRIELKATTRPGLVVGED